MASSLSVTTQIVGSLCLVTVRAALSQPYLLVRGALRVKGEVDLDAKWSASDTHLCPLPSDCTTAVETTDHHHTDHSIVLCHAISCYNILYCIAYTLYFYNNTGNSKYNYIVTLYDTLH